MAFPVFFFTPLSFVPVGIHMGIHYIKGSVKFSWVRLGFWCDGTDCSLLSVAYTLEGWVIFLYYL